MRVLLCGGGLLAFTCVFFGAGVMDAAAQCGPSISGRFGGEVSTVAQVNSSALLVARGTEAELYTLANPLVPAMFSTHRKVGLDAPAVKISMTQGSPRAFVLLANGDVQVITIRYSPLLTVSFPTSLNVADAVDILADDQKVYIATMYEEEDFLGEPYISSRIYVYDIASGTPVRISTTYPMNNAYGFDRLARVGNVLWGGFHELNSSIFGVEGFDISNPANPVHVSAALNNAPLGTYTYVTAMTSIGTNLLVSYRHDDFPNNDWMRAVTVATPASPVWQPAVNLNGQAGTMASLGTQLRISIKDSGIGTWQTSNPAALTWQGAYFDSFPEIGQMVCVTGTDYWAAGRAGLMTMNQTNVAAPSLRTTPVTPLPIGPSVVRQRGNTTVVLDYTLNTMRLFDYTLAEAQQLRSSFALPLYAANIEIGELAGGIVLACVATSGAPGGDSITIIDITNPAAPVTRSTISGFNPYLLSVSGSRLYAFTTAGDFKIYELALPATPQLRSTTHFGGNYADYTCMTSWSNNAAALGSKSLGLWLINTTNATAPVVSAVWNPVSNYHVSAIAKGSGSYMWVSASVGESIFAPTTTRLEALNVSNIAAPTQRFVHTAGSGASSQGVFSSLTFIQSPVAKFLVGTRDQSSTNDAGRQIYNSLKMYELPPGLFASEAVPFPIATMEIPYGQGNLALSADGSRFLVAAGERAGLYQFASPTQWAPGFASQPMSQQPCINGSAAFNSLASGNPTTVTYQWYRDGIALVNGPTGWGSTISGATEPSLFFTRVRPEDARDALQYHRYQCIASNSCGSTASFAVGLEVCPADFNCDGTVDFFDYLDFVDGFSAQVPTADYNIDGTIDFFDYLDFVDAFSTGC